MPQDMADAEREMEKSRSPDFTQPSTSLRRAAGCIKSGLLLSSSCMEWRENILMYSIKWNMLSW